MGQKTGSLNNLEGVPTNMANGSPASVKPSSVSGPQMINGAQDKVHPGWCYDSLDEAGVM